MTAPAYVISHGELVRELEPAAEPARLELLRLRALKLGEHISADIVDSGGAVLSISVYAGKPGLSRCHGHINVWPATEESEERWSLMTSCNATEGLPMQADVLVANAAAVAAAFKALVES